MKDKDLISERDECRLLFPEWMVKYVFSPFPDESGWVAVILKWAVLGLMCSVVIDGWLFPGLPLSSAWLPVVASASAALLCLLPWE